MVAWPGRRITSIFIKKTWVSAMFHRPSGLCSPQKSEAAELPLKEVQAPRDPAVTLPCRSASVQSHFAPFLGKYLRILTCLLFSK